MAGMNVTLRMQLLPHAVGAPTYQTQGSAGFDLQAAPTSSDAIDGTWWLPSGKRLLVPTGIVVELPPGFEGQIRPRSGLAVRHGVTVLNAPGTIDADYRGEVKVLLINHGSNSFAIKRGDRIAQFVITLACHGDIKVTTELTNTLRGQDSFGSTGC